MDSPPKLDKEDSDINTGSIPQITLVSGELHTEANIEPIAIKFSKKSLARLFEEAMESRFTTVSMTIVTLYALFGDDIKSLAFPSSTDVVFSSLVVSCMVLFALELVLSLLFRVEYRWSFYFWLDLVATLSLVVDISWMWDTALGISSGDSSSGALQNAAMASKAGRKTERVLTIISIVRLIRIVKLYKNIMIALKPRVKKYINEDEEMKEDEIISESNVGKKMSELTMKRAIILVLILLFFIPLFDTDFYYTQETSWDFGVYELNNFMNEVSYEAVKNEFISYHQYDLRPIVYLQYTNNTRTTPPYEWISDTSYTTLRYNELYFATAGTVIAIFDLRYDTRLTSLLNICRTIYICFALMIGLIYFSKDAENLVIKPIEQMLERVKIIARNPIAASEAKAADEDDVETMEKICCGLIVRPKAKAKEYETQILENTIVKIGVLLALGFGEAGSMIIGSNVEKGGDVDPMANGNKVVGIYGFCDIRNFTDTTEELQEGVMVFVNEIAQIVHGIVDKYMGAPNKNIGDAFLLVWKFSPDEFFLDDEEIIVRNPDSVRAKYLPDLSMLSFLKILAKVNKDPAMLKYRTNQKLLVRMPNYEVKMGFGMHLGTAIEGAIGSKFKIDASYLSPNVNVASALEGSTKIYGVPLLISGALFDIFSDEVKRYCRHIDTVIIKGNAAPVRLYTSDCDFTEFVPSKNLDRSKQFFRRKKRILRRELDKRNITTTRIFQESREVNLMRKAFTEEFYASFDKGLQSYLKGHWELSRQELEDTLKIKSRDGPSISLLNYMSEYGFIAPKDWKNSRYLG